MDTFMTNSTKWAVTDSDGHDKLSGIELLRFVSAVSVLLWHYQHFSFQGGISVDFVADRQPYYFLLKPFYTYGALGVHAFWCISGFIFFWKYGDAIANGMTSARTFFILRFSRLYPLHLATLLIVALLQATYAWHAGKYFVYQANDLGNFVLQLFMASNWLQQSVESFDGPVWSVSVEIVVYFLFFSVTRRFGSSFLVQAAIASAALLAAVLLRGSPPILICVLYFFLGSVTAWVHRQRFSRLTDLAVSAVSLFALLVVLASMVALAFGFGRVHSETSMLVGLPAALLLLSRHFSPPSQVRSMLATLGNLTYASYLLQFPFQLALVLLFAALGKHVPMYEAWFFIAYFTAILLLSRYCFSRFEVPAQRKIRAALLPSPRRPISGVKAV